jgi:hypothetical protein
MSITMSTVVEIEAPQQLMWHVLTDFSAYHEWNPDMEIEGSPQVGTKLTEDIMGASGGRGMVFKPAVLPCSTAASLPRPGPSRGVRKCCAVNHGSPLPLTRRRFVVATAAVCTSYVRLPVNGDKPTSRYKSELNERVGDNALNGKHL